MTKPGSNALHMMKKIVDNTKHTRLKMPMLKSTMSVATAIIKVTRLTFRLCITFYKFGKFRILAHEDEEIQNVEEKDENKERIGLRYSL